MNNQHAELFRRHKLNPILSAAVWPYPVNSIFNPGATRLSDGTTLLLCRVEDRTGHSHLTVARSDNGMDNWRIESRPTLLADPEQFPAEGICGSPVIVPRRGSHGPFSSYRRSFRQRHGQLAD